MQKNEKESDDAAELTEKKNAMMMIDGRINNKQQPTMITMRGKKENPTNN